MADLTLHTGCAGERTVINVDSFDHDNIQYVDKIEIRVEPEDKPRTLTVVINGRVVWQRQSNKEQY